MPFVAVPISPYAIREIRNARSTDGHGHLNRTRRSVSDLAARADAIAQARRAREEEIRERAKAKREREEAEARKKHIESLVGQEDGLWAKVDAIIATRQPKRYEEAVSLLQDLRDLAAMEIQGDAFSSRLKTVCREHARKPALLARFREAHLVDA